jgi:anti-anti-sigma factor
VDSDDRLRVESASTLDRRVLLLYGELDLAGAPLLAGEIERAESSGLDALVLDLSHLDFLDSAGLRVILAAHERARDAGRGFAITPGPPQVQKLLEIAGVDRHLRTIPSAEHVLDEEPGESAA